MRLKLNWPNTFTGLTCDPVVFCIDRNLADVGSLSRRLCGHHWMVILGELK